MAEYLNVELPFLAKLQELGWQSINHIRGIDILNGKFGSDVPGQRLSKSEMDLSTPPRGLSTPPQELIHRIEALKAREHDREKIEDIIQELCALRTMKASQIADYLGKGEDYIKRKYLRNLIASKKLNYTYPEMINHPDQAYKTTEN